MDENYAGNVFINCPLDEEYSSMLYAITFTVIDCGFVPQSALGETDSGDIRFEKIKRMMLGSKFGIHDISRTELDDIHGLPRFNMPYELGFFAGIASFGRGVQREKRILILDKEKYRYQKFISDIAGQDICSHDNCERKVIICIRNWLNDASGRKTIPGGKKIEERYREFQSQLPEICKKCDMTMGEITHNDFKNFVYSWLDEQKRS